MSGNKGRLIKYFHSLLYDTEKVFIKRLGSGVGKYYCCGFYECTSASVCVMCGCGTMTLEGCHGNSLSGDGRCLMFLS